MCLKFFGRCSGFTSEHTSAYFETDEKEMVIIDCPISTYNKLLKMDLSKYDVIYVLITHTHGDHISGLGLLSQYAFYTLKKHLVIVAPCDSVKTDIDTLLRIEGNDATSYNLVTAEALKQNKWFKSSIMTEHSPQLYGKCFGYILNINNESIIYTGDTSTLEPFIKYMCNSILYVDTSVHYGMIHLKLEDSLKDFKYFLNLGVLKKVYLMHLDDGFAAEKIVEDIPNIEVVKTI